MPNYTTYDSEALLLHDFRHGVEMALKVIYRQHYHSLWSFANRLVKDEAMVDDIIAESYVKLWHKRLEMDSLKGMIAYLYAIVRNGCISCVNERSRRDRMHKELAYINQLQDVAVTEEIRARLMQTIKIETENLPPQMREVFKLAYLEGLLAPAIAERMSLSVHTVHTHKKLAMKKLRKALEKKGFTRWSYILFL